MNAMTGAQSDSLSLTADALIQEEMRVFQETLRKALPPETLKKANYLLSILSDIFYYRGHINVPGPNADALKNHTQIQPMKKDFSIEVGNEESKGFVNLLDLLKGFLKMRSDNGYFSPAQSPHYVGRWLTDVNLMASGRDTPLRRSKFMGATADAMPPRLQPTLSPADQLLEEQANSMEAALRRHGIATEDALDLKSILAGPGYIEKPAEKPFLLPEDDYVLDFSFPETEEEKARLEAQRKDEEAFHENLERAIDSIAAPDQKPVEGAVAQPLEENDIPGLDELFEESLEEDMRMEAAAAALHFHDAAAAAALAQDPVNPEYVFERDIEIDMTAFEAEVMLGIAQENSERLHEKVQDAIEELRAADLDEEMMADPVLTPHDNAQVRDPLLFSHALETDTDIENARRLAQKFAPQKWDSQAEYKHSRWDPATVEHITAKKGYVKTIATVGATMFMMSASRMALVAGATALGVGALPAVALAGLAVGAAHTFYTNRREIMNEASKVDTLREKSAVIYAGVRRTFTWPKAGLIVAGAVGGTLAGQWVAANSDWLIDRAAGFITAAAAAGRDLVAQLPEMQMPTVSLPEFKMPDFGFGTENATATAQPAATEYITPEARVVKTIPVSADGVPVTASTTTLDATPVISDVAPSAEPTLVLPVEDRFGGDFPVASPDVAQDQQLIAAFEEKAKTMVDGVSASEVMQPASTQPLALDTVSDPVIADRAPATTDIAQAPDATTEIVAGEEVTPSAPPPLETKTHVVERGDRNLWKIAQEIFGVKGEATRDAVEAIIAQNPELAANPNKLSLGQELVIPAQLDGAPQAECKWTRRAVTCVIPSP